MRIAQALDAWSPAGGQIFPRKNLDALDEHFALAQSARQEWRVVLVTGPKK
jgi:hypothetical protein